MRAKSLWRYLATAVAGAVLTAFALGVPARAQETGTVGQADSSGALIARPAEPASSAGSLTASADEGLNYDSWDRMAQRAEAAIGSRSTTSETLEQLRRQLVDWREALLGAQNANAARIATLRTQIAALGPAPAAGQVEAEEIATRRSELSDQLVRLQAPGIAAEEAYRRADGLISEIDRVQRERQADALLQLWPAPINPSNWPEAVIALTDMGVRIWDETAEQAGNALARRQLGNNAPLIIALLAMAGGLFGFGRRRIERVAQSLQERASARGRRVWSFLASLGVLVFPLVGVSLVMVALERSRMVGEIGTLIVEGLPRIAFPLIAASWLAGRIFPRGQVAGPLNLGAERRAEGRTLAVMLGLLLALERLRAVAIGPQGYSDGATSVMSFPGLALSALLLFRMGQLLSRHVAQEKREAEGGAGYGLTIQKFLARGVMTVAVIGPVLGAVGYVAAAAALVYPAVLSLALVGLLLALQDLVIDLYAILLSRDAAPDEALVPVLANFALSLATLPLFALIWGARVDDLTELWMRFQEGFTLGETKISPTQFLFFAVVFAIGFTLTRMLQGALRASVLPRTGLDQGGQNAVVSGVGYVGILLAGLVAINSTGIDLSGLAIVAGALSVGIGFGLQTVVSNFVSGIILLIERPVSEGDWIEVGPVQGIVKSISVRSTRIQTFDRSDVIVPNSDLISGRVTNWTRYNLSGRLIVPVAVPYTADSRRVEAILREIAEAQPMAVLKPPPVIAFMGFGGEAMNFEIRLILRDVNFTIQVRSEINHQIAARFAADGIDLSAAHRDHRQRLADKAATEAEEKAEAEANRAAVAAALSPVTGKVPAK